MLASSSSKGRTPRPRGSGEARDGTEPAPCVDTAISTPGWAEMPEVGRGDGSDPPHLRHPGQPQGDVLCSSPPGDPPQPPLSQAQWWPKPGPRHPARVPRAASPNFRHTLLSSAASPTPGASGLHWEEGALGRPFPWRHTGRAPASLLKCSTKDGRMNRAGAVRGRALRWRGRSFPCRPALHPS